MVVSKLNGKYKGVAVTSALISFLVFLDNRKTVQNQPNPMKNNAKPKKTNGKPIQSMKNQRKLMQNQ